MKLLNKNPFTGIVYSGNNQRACIQAVEENSYPSNEWGTFLQFKAAGLKLKGAKGKGIKISNGFSRVEVENKKNKKTIENKTIPNGWSYIFNLSLCEKIEQ